MMEKRIKEKRYRFLAFIMAVILLVGMLPVSALNVWAETPGNLKGTGRTGQSERAVRAGQPEEAGLPVPAEGTVQAGQDTAPGIEKIEIHVLDSVYEKGKEQALVTDIQGCQEGDVLSYSTDGINWGADIPVGEDAGTYSVYVKIARAGYDDYESGELTAVIGKAEITDVDITEYRGEYDGTEHAAVSMEGLLPGDKVTCTYNGADTTFVYSDEASVKVPAFENAGSYTVRVTIERDGNYHIFEQTYTAEVIALAIEGIEASLRTGLVYNGEAQELVEKLEGTQDGDKVFFSVSDGDGGGSGWTQWTQNRKPEAVDAGEYTVQIKVTRENHEDKEIALNPATVTIEKAEQTLKFTRDNLEETVSLSAKAADNVYDFTAQGGAGASPVITYHVENASEGDGTDISEIARIVESGKDAGQLTVLGAGNVTVTATVAGDANHNEKSVSHHLTIVDDGEDLLSFDEDAATFAIGAIGHQTALCKYGDDNGAIVYSGTVSGSDAQLGEVGLGILPDGSISVSDLKTLGSAVGAAGGTLSVKISAGKAAGTKTAWGKENIVYGAGEASYILNITTEEIPASAYTMQDGEGNPVTAANGSNGWYNTVVTVVPARGYSIARDEMTADYQDSVAFGETVDGTALDQGRQERVIYLKNKETGAITAPITIALDQLDTVKPDIQPIQFQRFAEEDVKYFGREVTVTFTAYDETSGVDTFAWSYARSEGASASILEADGGLLQAKQDADDPTKYTAELTLPREAAVQLRGNLTVSANDAAGNSSDAITDEGVFIIDSIPPVQEVRFGPAQEGTRVQTVDSVHYFSGAVEFTVTVAEANFYPEDMAVTVSKDGGEGVPVQDVEWEATENPDEYEAGITISGDGAYVVGVSCKDRFAADRSGQEVMEWQSDVVVVDTVKPVIAFRYADHGDLSAPQTAQVTVTEHNFRQGDIEVITSARTIAGETADTGGMDLQQYLRTCEWTTDADNGDIHRAFIPAEVFAEARYELTIDYKDLAWNPAGQLRTEPFIVDHTAPEMEKMEISYSKPVQEKSVADTILSTITFGYYNPALTEKDPITGEEVPYGLTVTFTAYDVTSGVDYFSWEYERQEGASEGNVEKYDDPGQRVAAVQDEADKTKFTASVTLPKEQAGQLRGSIAFTATDGCGNTSDRLEDDGHVVIVDTVSPAMKVQYTAPDDMVLDKAYYHGDITASFIVTEANFYSQDVVVKVAKDHGEETEITPEWTDVSADVHVGTYTIEVPKDHSADGDYVFTVSYTDRSGNIMDTYTSGLLVADTTAPVGTAAFGLKEEGGNHKEVGDIHYFSDDVEFTFGVAETNFYPEDVSVTVSRDGMVSGQTLTWGKTENKDEYEAKLTLSEDGAYVVEMSYRDRSGQVMDSYQSEIVVVDKTMPVIEFIYHDNTDALYPQTAQVTVTEHNFRQGDIEVATSAKTIAGEPADTGVMDLQEYLRTCEWTTDGDNGDIHRAFIPAEVFADARYELTIDYRDLAWNPAGQLGTGLFLVDHTAPETEEMEISYSRPVRWESIADTILSTITFGYYNPTATKTDSATGEEVPCGLTVTFTAYDVTAGVDYFTWGYERQEGASEGNVEKYDAPGQTVAAVQDTVDKTKFTASVTLPREQAQQLRGSITFAATDRYGNVSGTLADKNHVVIVDTISPTMTAQYPAPDNTFGNKAYYHNGLTAIFTVTEANFYQEDVVVKVSRDNGEGVAVTPQWTDLSADVHVGTYTIHAPADHSADGDYTFTVSYRDRSDNTMRSYTSGILVVDTTAPVIRVEYGNQTPVNTLADPAGNERKYFASTQTATITITEHNFNPQEVEYTLLAQDISGGELNADALHEKSAWEDNGDVHVQTITYPGDANYTFGIAYTDLARLAAGEYETEYFTVDTTPPRETEVSYSTSVLDTILSAISFGFYNAKMTVTMTARDDISGVYSFRYGYLNAEGVSAVNAQLEEAVLEMDSITFSDDDVTATAVFEIPGQALAADSQFNGTVTFDATDRSGNQSDPFQDSKRIVVDNLSPTADVEYNEPVQTVNGVSYYDGTISATVTINEANFYPEDVEVSVTKDGASYAVTPAWTDQNTDVHVGAFTLTEDGDYFVDIAYTDKSGNIMEQYTSEQMTIDTKIKPVDITFTGTDADGEGFTYNAKEADGKAFSGEVVLTVSFNDPNFDDYDIQLTRTRYGDKDRDVKSRFIPGTDPIHTDGTGGFGSFDTFGKLPENDGIYTLTVSQRDKAGNDSSREPVNQGSVTFTINRYGSVYEYDDYLISLIQDGGAYVRQVDEDLVITEYNANRLKAESLDIAISRDGKPLIDPDYDVTPEMNSRVEAGSSGWFQYRYAIDKENFSMDGVYKISVSSMDEAENTPENSNYEDKGILFRVDSTPPEIDSITGLEESIINATSVEVKYSVYDTIGLASVAAYIDGKECGRITDFTEDGNHYSGSLTLSESTSAQTVRLVVEDLAGNVTDTASDDFDSAYAFHSTVTVSTNAFVRWYANKTLFFSSIGGLGALAAGTGGLTVFFKRRKASKAGKG